MRQIKYHITSNKGETPKGFFKNRIFFKKKKKAPHTAAVFPSFSCPLRRPFPGGFDRFWCSLPTKTPTVSFMVHGLHSPSHGGAVKPGVPAHPPASPPGSVSLSLSGFGQVRVIIRRPRCFNWHHVEKEKAPCWTHGPTSCHVHIHTKPFNLSDSHHGSSVTSYVSLSLDRPLLIASAIFKLYEVCYLNNRWTISNPWMNTAEDQQELLYGFF